MKQIIYAMQFTGLAGPTTTQGVLEAKTLAKSCRITSVVTDGGLSGEIEGAAGGTATFESIVTVTGDTSFLEAGSIDFGHGNVLRFSTVGQGYLAGSADPNMKHGTVTWRLDSGGGQFAGATGLITSNFTIDGSRQVVDNHFGVIFLA